MSHSAPLLSVRDLTIALPAGSDQDYAVHKVSYDIHPGEILCLVGESGSGKSLSANAIMGLLPADLQPPIGQILFRGVDLLRQNEATLCTMRGKDIAMVFQEPLTALNPLMTIGQQIAEVMQVHQAYPGRARIARVLELLAFVGLPDPATLYHAYPFRLSGGQRQRVVIAMALALEPALLIADEPTTALDVTTQAQILALIARIQKEKGMAILFITHDLSVVADIADRVAVMEQGRVVELGASAEVLNRPSHSYTRKLIAAVPHRYSFDPSPTLSDTPVLEVRHLRKTYITRYGWRRKKHFTHAVDDVSFTVHRGETLGIVGESGSGKSTLGKCLLKLISADEGQLLFNGRDVAGLPERQFRPLRKHIQMIFQDPFSSLNPRHTIGRIISDGLITYGQPRARAEQRARELLTLVGLDAAAFNRYPNQFSGGQRQRICIARALALEPHVLVADESLSALDVSVQAQVLRLLRELQQRLHIALIFITHDLRVAAQICDAVLVMYRGKVVEYGNPTQIFDEPQHPYTRQLIAAVPGQRWHPCVAD